MTDAELASCYATLGVEPGASREVLAKALMQKNFALIRAASADAARAGAVEEEKARLKAAHDAILAHFGELERQEAAAVRAQAREGIEERELARLVAQAEADAARFKEPEPSRWDPRSFDSAVVNVVAPPVTALAAIAVQKSPFAMFFLPFYIWVHEFGHATIGWLTGHRALPLPLGWTPIAAEKSLFVYGGILFLFGLLFFAGARERKFWPMFLAIGLAILQGYMTWRLPETTAKMWISFCGVGGEFYLSAAMVALFYVRLPEKFRWGACRYFFLFVGAGTFYSSFALWRKIKHGDEGIPYGSMINGEDDASGDMNGLHDEFGWTQHDIIWTYNRLATTCLVAMAIVYVFFALRLDRPIAKWINARATAEL